MAYKLETEGKAYIAAGRTLTTLLQISIFKVTHGQLIDIITYRKHKKAWDDLQFKI
jgi:hypothetical protein